MMVVGRWRWRLKFGELVVIRGILEEVAAFALIRLVDAFEVGQACRVQEQVDSAG